MELGDGGIRWFRYVPVWSGNRNLPENEQLSLEIRRPRTVEVLSQNDTPGELEEWKQTRLEKWLANEEYGPYLKKLPTDVLTIIRQFVEGTRAFKNFVFDGREVTDPVEIFLRTSVNVKAIKTSLTIEITNAIGEAAALSGGALKNFVAQCGGSKQVIMPTNNLASSVKPVSGGSIPSDGAANPNTALTLPEQTEPSHSVTNITDGMKGVPA